MVYNLRFLSYIPANVCVFVYVCVLLGSLGLLFEYLFRANYLLDTGTYLLYSSRTVPVKGDK